MKTLCVPAPSCHVLSIPPNPSWWWQSCWHLFVPGTGKTESMGTEDVSADSQCACERRSDTLSGWIALALCWLAELVHLKLLHFDSCCSVWWNMFRVCVSESPFRQGQKVNIDYLTISAFWPGPRSLWVPKAPLVLNSWRTVWGWRPVQFACLWPAIFWLLCSNLFELIHIIT